MMISIRLELALLGHNHLVEFLGERGDVLVGEAQLLLEGPETFERHDGLGAALVADLIIMWLKQLVDSFYSDKISFRRSGKIPRNYSPSAL
jgi:hypothetical protein